MEAFLVEWTVIEMSGLNFLLEFYSFRISEISS